MVAKIYAARKDKADKRALLYLPSTENEMKKEKKEK